MDFQGIDEQLGGRSSDQVSSCFVNEQDLENLFLLGESDSGVARNGGRRGARFAPQAVLACLKKLAKHRNCPSYQISVMDQITEEKHFFQEAQTISSKRILQAQQNYHVKNFIHLGGGHDHIYPLLKALEHQFKKITIINIDAHCDTRNDQLAHSGTPFAQFAKETKADFQLIQLGIHEYANTQSTLNSVKGMQIFTPRNLPKDFQQMINFLNETIEIEKDRTYVISLDCDAIESASMEAVSAVNHNGLSMAQVKAVFYWGKYHANSKYYGIYEYNPVYDNLSQKGARTIAGLVYELFYAN